MIGSYKLGFEHSTVSLNGSPYLERWFIAIAGWTFRLHRFHRGDEDRAMHDHPWAFWTFPFTGYYERYATDFNRSSAIRYVKPWRFHYRPRLFRHIVLHPNGKTPWWTFVIAAAKTDSWGFWPSPREFIPWRKWHGKNG